MNTKEIFEHNFIEILNCARAGDIESLKRAVIKRDMIHLGQKSYVTPMNKENFEK